MLLEVYNEMPNDNRQVSRNKYGKNAKNGFL